MEKLLTIIFAFLTGVLIGQKTFTNTYNVEVIGNYKYSFDDCHSILEHKNSLFTIGTLQENRENTASATDGISDTTHSMLMKYDLNGDLIFRNFYTPNSCSSNIYNFIRLGDTLLAGGPILSPKNYCGVYLIDNPPPGVDLVTKGRIYFTSTDLTTGSFKQAIYRTGVSCGPFGILPSHDGNFFVANLVQDDQSINLLKINSTLDSLSNKKLFDSVPDIFTPTYFEKTKNGYVILLTSVDANSSHFQFLNKNGDTTHYVDFPFRITAISKTDDNGFIAMTTEVPTNPRLIKFDENLNVKWQRNYPVYSNSFVKQTKDGNYIIGNKTFAKVNKDSVIWSKRYFGPDNIQPWYFLFDAIETSDGGFALTGFYDANTLLIKTDCRGNLIWDSNCKTAPSDTVKPVAIFPNPFKDEVTFQLPDLTTPFNMRIVNMLGEVVFDQVVTNNIFKVNTTSLAADVYIYCIYDHKNIYRTGKIIKI
jgi:hypothetical protein